MISPEHGWFRIGGMWLNAALAHHPGINAVADEQPRTRIHLANGTSVLVDYKIDQVIERINQADMEVHRPVREPTEDEALAQVQNSPVPDDPYIAQKLAENQKADREYQASQDARLADRNRQLGITSVGLSPELAKENARRAQEHARAIHSAEMAKRGPS